MRWKRVIKPLLAMGEKVLRDPKKFENLMRQVDAKALRDAISLETVKDEFKTVARLVSKSVTGEYGGAPWKSLVLAAAAFLYFVNPFDLVPDFLPLGLVDDLSLLSAVFLKIKTDIDAFKAWEKTGKE